jgi:hypothetical protein
VGVEVGVVALKSGSKGGGPGDGRDVETDMFLSHMIQDAAECRWHSGISLLSSGYLRPSPQLYSAHLFAW